MSHYPRIVEGANLVEGSTVYLSGPMDFVADRQVERETGWRSRLTSYLVHRGVRVYDPWYKPVVRNLKRGEGYGQEPDGGVDGIEAWTFGGGEDGARARWAAHRSFWPVMHIDLRMVDLADFVIACTPSNLYSVGTPHEIVVAREQHKPVLLVSPPVRLPAWDRLKAAVPAEHADLVDEALSELGVRPNDSGRPSPWYMALIDPEHVFGRFDWSVMPKLGLDVPPNHRLDAADSAHPEDKALLTYLEAMAAGRVPQRWNGQVWEDDDDWLLLAERSIDKIDREG